MFFFPLDEMQCIALCTATVIQSLSTCLQTLFTRYSSGFPGLINSATWIAVQGEQGASNLVSVKVGYVAR